MVLTRLRGGYLECLPVFSEYEVKMGGTMGAIIDVVLIGEREKAIIIERYPKCLLHELPGCGQKLQKYRLIIPGEDLDDTYYNFLVDHTIATASSNFRNRLDSDEAFTLRMRRRAEAVMIAKEIDVQE